MPIIVPAQGNLVSPSGIQALSVQGQIALSWSISPLATTYYISRSTDQITWACIDQTALSNYADTTAVLGTVYYYYVQAGATISSVAVSSYPSEVVSGISLFPGQTTCGNIILEAQQRCNKENSSFYTPQELISMCSQSYKEAYGILIQKYGCDYFIAPPYSYSTTGVIDPVYQAQVFPLPKDFYKLMRVEVAMNQSDNNAWITLRQFNAIQANLYNYPNIYTMYGVTNLRYRLWGTNLQIVPITTAGQTIRIWYSPKPNQLIATTDLIDMVSGWEELIVVDMCEKMMVKEESFDSAQAFSTQKQALIKRIEEEAENRNVGEAETVSDSKTRNFAWTSGGASDGFGGGSGGY